MSEDYGAIEKSLEAESHSGVTLKRLVSNVPVLAKKSFDIPGQPNLI